MRILDKLFTKNRFKINIECVFKHSMVCSVLKRQFFSQEILREERIPTGSHEEKNALIIVNGKISLWTKIREAHIS